MPGEDLQYSWDALREARAWASGEKTHHNLFLQLEADPEHRVQTLLAIAQADAAEVVKYSALAQALITKERVAR